MDQKISSVQGLRNRNSPDSFKYQLKLFNSSENWELINIPFIIPLSSPVISIHTSSTAHSHLDTDTQLRHNFSYLFEGNNYRTIL
jgi:hypothetical protein